MNVDVASDEALTIMTMRKHLRSPLLAYETVAVIVRCEMVPDVDGSSVMATLTGLKLWMKGNNGEWGIRDSVAWCWRV